MTPQHDTRDSGDTTPNTRGFGLSCKHSISWNNGISGPSMCFLPGNSTFDEHTLGEEVGRCQNCHCCQLLSIAIQHNAKFRQGGEVFAGPPLPPQKPISSTFHGHSGKTQVEEQYLDFVAKMALHIQAVRERFGHLRWAAFAPRPLWGSYERRSNTLSLTHCRFRLFIYFNNFLLLIYFPNRHMRGSVILWNMRLLLFREIRG